MMKFFCWVSFGLFLVQFLSSDLVWAGKEKTSGRYLTRPSASDFQDPSEFERAFQEWRAYRQITNERVRKWVEKKKLGHVPKKRVHVTECDCEKSLDERHKTPMDRVFRSKRLTERQKHRGPAVASGEEVHTEETDLMVGAEQSGLRLPELRNFLDFNPEGWFEVDPQLFGEELTQDGTMWGEEDHSCESFAGEASAERGTASSLQDEFLRASRERGRLLESLETLLQSPEGEALSQSLPASGRAPEAGVEDPCVSDWFLTSSRGVSHGGWAQKEEMSMPNEDVFVAGSSSRL